MLEAHDTGAYPPDMLKNAMQRLAAETGQTARAELTEPFAALLAVARPRTPRIAQPLRATLATPDDTDGRRTTGQIRPKTETWAVYRDAEPLVRAVWPGAQP